MVLPLAGKPISMRTKRLPSEALNVQADRSKISCPHRLTLMSPLLPEPLALKLNRSI